MYFKQIRRNAKRSRKDNGLFFGSLVVAIIAFYTLLSLENQDVMVFLKIIESDAVGKLMMLIPIVYVVSLFFVFFLVYFAYSYQIGNREKEFGLYLMLGMKRRRLFFMLMGETIWNSLASLLLGVPIALFLTEAVSLTTSKLVGLGIMGHQISFSVSAIIITIIGFLAVQLIAMLFLSGRICYKEPVELLHSGSITKQKPRSIKSGAILFVISLFLLGGAYFLGIAKLKYFDLKIVVAVLVLGSAGTFLFYCGLGALIGNSIQKRSRKKAGLFTFTGRQIQENVIHEYKVLAVASLLLLMGIACISFGIGTASNYGISNSKSVDFSIQGEAEDVISFLEEEENKKLIDSYYPMRLNTMYELDNNISWDGLTDNINKTPESGIRDNIVENLLSDREVYLISETSYNKILQAKGEESIKLAQNEAALFTSMGESGEFVKVYNGALENQSHINIGENKIQLQPRIYTDNVVADRSITIYLALIVSDENYNLWADDSNEMFCWNVLLNQDIIKEKGLIQAIQYLKANLDKTDLVYESYLNSIGRTLFYMVASSYLTLYLGVLFIIIANTVIGLKYLMQQRAAKRRYLTLMMLGANMNQIYRSVRNQIRIFFYLVLGLAMFSSIFMVWSLFTGIMDLPLDSPRDPIVLFTAIIFILVVIFEIVYMHIVKRAGNQEIRLLQEAGKGEE